MSVASSMRNAYIDFGAMTASVVAVTTDIVRSGVRVVGYGFTSNGRYAVGCLLRDRFIPRILAANGQDLLDDAGTNLDPSRVLATAMDGEKPGGHGERAVAVGALDMAIWDIVAKVEDRPLYQVLADRYRQGSCTPRVFVYAAGGYYQDGKGTEALKDEVRRFLDQGYTVVKIKIGGASLDDDLRRIEAALSIVGSGMSLAVDANGRFTLDQAIAYGRAIEPYGLRWYEEAGDPLDFDLQATLVDVYAGAMATGENLLSMQDVRNLVRYGGLRPTKDFLQFDCALSYGLVEYMRTLDAIAAYGWSPDRCIPHGGHQLSLHIAAGLGLAGNESYPGEFRPFGGFADGIPVEEGYVRIPDAPGIGFETKRELMTILRAMH